MRTARVKHSISYLFLILFLSMKLVGLHALSHHEDDDDHDLHCVVCYHAAAINHTPALAPDLQEFSFEIKEYVFTQDLRKYYNYIHSNAIASNELFCRPPPTLL
ncbi:hypothetical protein [Formosa algae]|uniref:hypothetical protein n=1 Tax=Formosa algae TaxID=225843 RepID=UPI0011AF4631|nr:hypothetical protein [Formosa algae]